MASPCGSCISGLSITSTIIRATYPPRPSGHISSGEERPRGTRTRAPHRARSVRDSSAIDAPGNLRPSGRRWGSQSRPGKEWHVTVESGAVTTAAPTDQTLVQLLTPEGERIDHPDYPLDLSAADIRDLYRDLVLVRRIDTEAIALQRQGELGIWASLLGQEAAQVGSGRALGPRDMAFPTYREHGVAWCRGLDPTRLRGLFRGGSHGGWDPNAHRFHLYTIVIGSQTLHATGYALGVQRDGAVGEDGEAVIAYFGDGAT